MTLVVHDFATGRNLEIEATRIDRILRPTKRGESGALVLMSDGRWHLVRQGPKTLRILAAREQRRSLL